MATRHPAENYIRFLVIQDRNISDGDIQKKLEDCGFLSADPTYLPLLKNALPPDPVIFQPFNRAHRPSVRFLREQKVYELFHPTEAMVEAQELLGDPEKRRTVEQILLARLDLRIVAQKVNAKHNWHLTVDALELFRHYFWNVPAMTFDEWGRYMFKRTAMYDQYMSLLLASPTLAFYHLRLDQNIESKRMIQDVQKIAHATILEVAEKPGSSIDKVKSIKLLGTVVIEAHNALSTSDMALKDVLKQFEHWRMDHPPVLPPTMAQLAGSGTFSGLSRKDNVIDLHPTPIDE
jgi:hypothetical protein